MNVLNIEVMDMYVKRFSDENSLDFSLETTNGNYNVTLAIRGVSDLKFWEDSYGVSGSPVWVDSNVNDVVDYVILSIYDDNDDVVTNPDIVSEIENAIYGYDFSEINETVEELVMNEIRASYDW